MPMKINWCGIVFSDSYLVKSGYKFSSKERTNQVSSNPRSFSRGLETNVGM